MTIATQPPAPLDIYTIHSPEVIRAWQKSQREYFDAIQSEKQELQRAEAEARAQANRVLTEEEYYQAALAREAANTEKRLMQDVAEAAADQAKNDWLASSPDQVNLLEVNPVTFILTLQHWTKKNYVLDDSAELDLTPGFYRASLNKPQGKKAPK